MNPNSTRSNTIERSAPSAARAPDREAFSPVAPSRSGDSFHADRCCERSTNVRDVVRQKGRRIETINGFEQLRSAALKMRGRGVSALVVTERTVICGLISEREIVEAVSFHGAAAILMNVRDVMLKDIRTIALSDSSARAVQLMTRNRVRHLLVTEDDVVAGLVSIDDFIGHETTAPKFEPALFVPSNVVAA